MTDGAVTAQDEGKAGAPKETQGFDLSFLWLWPVILFLTMFQALADHFERMKEMRRKPMPKDWRQAIPGLITGEWYIRDAIAQGVEALLKGEELCIPRIIHVDIASIPTMPADLHIPEPKSARETHRRFEATARFYANPEKFIRRAARRSAAARAKLVHGLEVEPSAAAAAAVFFCRSTCRRIPSCGAHPRAASSGASSRKIHSTQPAGHACETASACTTRPTA